MSFTSPAANTPGTLVCVEVGCGADIAFVIHVELAFEQLGGRRMADGDEQAVDRERVRRAVCRGCADVMPVTPRRVVGAQNLVDHGVVTDVDFRLAARRIWLVLSARSTARRWIRVTWSAKLVRNSASSAAVLPPPTTATFLPRKKKPSQVAQAETPKPLKFSSDGSPSQLACAPVAMINGVAPDSARPNRRPA